MSGTTAFPGALDTFPEIGPNTPENAPGLEHDVVRRHPFGFINEKDAVRRRRRV